MIATDRTFTEVAGGLVPGLPEFPPYPGAELVGSSQQNPPDQPIDGYRIKWTTPDSVDAVIAWYGERLPSQGWRFQAPNDGAVSEQEARISRGALHGYVAAEASDDDGTEIVVSLQIEPTLLAAGVDEAAFTFGAGGDFTGGNKFLATIEAIKQHNPAFMLALGDLSYDSQEAAWCKHWTDIAFPKLFLLSGNHDSGENKGGNINNYIAACPSPIVAVEGAYGMQYYFDYPRNAPLARFIMVAAGLGNKYLNGLDTNYAKGRQGYAFTETAIDDARKKGIKWLFVGMHKNYISPLEKSNEVSPDRTFMSMLLNKRVDVILQGHEHGYARSKQLAIQGFSCRVLPTDDFDNSCIVDHDDALKKGAGTVIHILGTAGKTGRGIFQSDVEYPFFAKSNGDVNGFGQFTVTVSRVTFDFKRSGGEGFTDAFVIYDGTPVVTR